METGKATTTAAVLAVPTTAMAKGRCQTMMEKAPPKVISIRRVNSMEIKLDTIYEDTFTTTTTTAASQVTEKQISFGDSKAIPRGILSPSWLKTKPTLLDVHQGGATSA